MTTSEREDVALAIHHILEVNGLSEFVRSLQKSNGLYQQDKIIELGISSYKIFGINAAFCGSSQEGLLPLFMNFGIKTDLDMLYILCKSKAYEDRSVVTSTDQYQYFIQNCEDYPGYATLQLVKEGSMMFACLSTCYAPYVRGDDGQMSLSNILKDKLAMFGALADINNIVKMPNELPLTGTHHQGPSVEHNLSTATCGFTNGFEFEKYDTVYAIPSPQWPTIANEWITRERKYGWPTSDLIVKIQGLNACLVPMGFKGSPTEKLQWKYSFSHSEKHLIWSLNAVQFKCYAVLKLLKIFVLGPVLGDIISSYIIKTSLLWTVEGTPSNIWQPPMLLDCTKRCLMRIKNWVTKDLCPNYIMRECNLLRDRYTENEKGLVLETLTDLIENLERRICHIPPIMKELETQSVQQLARQNEISMSVYENLSADPEVSNMATASMNKNESMNMDIFIPIHYGECLQSDKNIQNTMSLLSTKIETLASNLVSDKYHLILCILLKAKLILLSAMHQLSRCDRKNIQIYKLLAHMKRLCNPVQKMKFIANVLYLATIYLRMNECHRTLKITKEIVEYFQKHLYIRADYSKLLLNPTLFEAVKQTVMECDSHELNDNCTNMFVNDVHFAIVEFPHLPQPIQFELLCREKSVQDTGALIKLPGEVITAIDPLVYTSFLQFWCHRQLQNNAEQLMAIRHLRETCEHAMTTHKDIAWNLLGYCYRTLGQNQDAFFAFYQALKQKPKSRASLLYIALLLNDRIWEEWRQIY